MLVWLKEVANIEVDHIRASVPKDNTFLAYLVSLLYTFSQFYIIAIKKCQLLSMFKQVLLFYVGKGKLFIPQINIPKYHSINCL